MLNYFSDEMVLAQVVRTGAGVFAQGVWAPGTQVTATVSIIEPQPVTADELTPAEQGEDITDFLRTYSVIPLKTRDKATATDADVIIWAGLRYVVWQVERRRKDAFYRVIIKRTYDR